MLQPYSKVLVVDDSATARKCIRRLLNDLGFHFVREASDGHEATERLSAQPFDLVVSDWDMEGMDGLELLKWMRQKKAQRTIPFIMATAFVGRKYQDIARASGATFYLAKPIRPEDLSARLDQIPGALVAA